MNNTSNNDILLDAQNVKKYFPVHGGLLSRKVGEVKALNEVSFQVRKGETLGVVGESGCGKSTLGKTLLRLNKPDAGKVLFHGTDLFSLTNKELLPLRQKIQMIFQDPYSSLNPRMTVGDIIREPLDIFKMGTYKERMKKVEEMMEIVGMRKSHLSRYPHEFSGGQRQRIGIARSMVLRPELIVADEPVSALDVSIQSQILNLMNDLQKEFKLTYIFIAHNLSVVEYISDRVAVMYLGNIVELGNRNEIFSKPRHPYTNSLLASIPIADPKLRSKKTPLTGEIPSPLNPPSGCAFHPRCPYATEKCKIEKPILSSDAHQVACFHPLN